MSDRPRVDDVDLFVGGITPDPQSHEVLVQEIAASKSHPDHLAQRQEAAKILAEIEIDHLDYGLEKPEDLLKQWQRCIDDLAQQPVDGLVADR